MSQLGSCFERDDVGGGRYRHVAHLKPIAYLRDGMYQRIASAFVDSGIGARPHIVTAAPLMVSVADDGMRRIHPTRELDRYAEIGPPYAYIAGSWQKVAFSGATRTGNTITWHRAQADLSVTHGGHFIKMDIELLGGYVPPNGQFAFPVGLTGLTRTGGTIYRDGVPVMSVRAPSVHDAANVEDTRPIAYQFVQVAGQWYVLLTLPSLAGMSRPVVDPTLVLQPDAAAGKDTWVQSSAADTAFATETSISFRKAAKTGLLQFDYSTVPAGAIVSSASLKLTNNAVVGGPNTCTIYPILAANNGWVEAATWNYADGAGAADRWAGDAGNNGGADAGCSIADTDYGVAMGSFVIANNDPVGTVYTVALNAAAMQAMLIANYGFAFIFSSEFVSGYVASSDHATAAWRPQLTIEYSLSGGRLRRAWRR